jgi:hypothetical protein
MSVTLPKPKLMTSDEVVLSRDDWERIVSAFRDREAEAETAED